MPPNLLAASKDVKREADTGTPCSWRPAPALVRTFPVSLEDFINQHYMPWPEQMALPLRRVA